jgi:ATP-binding cassette, subfamily B, bacterial PglK
MFALTARKLWQLLSPHERRHGAVLLLMMMLGMLLETLGVGLVIPLIALLSEPGYVQRIGPLRGLVAVLGNPGPQTLVMMALVCLVVVYLLKNLYLAFLAWHQTRFSFRVQARLSQKLFSTYLGQPYTFHLQRNSAQLIRNAITEIGYITGRVLTPGLQMGTEMLVVIGLCALLLTVEPLGAGVVIAVLGGAAWLFHHVTRARMSYWGKERQRHEGLRIQHLQQGLGGAKDIKLLGREGYFSAAYEVHNVKSAHAGRFHSALQQMPPLGLEFLAVLGLVGVIAIMMMRGRELGAVVPTVGLFAAVAFRLMPSVNRILLATQSLRYGMPAIDVVHAELMLAPAAPASAAQHSIAPFAREIRVASVDFAYPGVDATSLQQLSLQVAHGESVGIIGPSGSGKSTLVNLVLGLLSPTRGSVEVDGVDIRSDMRGWQNQIGYVPQSIFLTDDTLLRNVAFGIPHDQIDHAAVARAIKSAQLDQFVASLPEGLDTVVGERGVRISGGQRQRIGIARALYHDPAVLVLDEATSSLDGATEAGVMEAVNAFHGQKTTIIVAHRLSTVENCDRLYRLDHGRVVEEISKQRTPESRVRSNP